LMGCADWTRSPNCMLNTKPLGRRAPLKEQQDCSAAGRLLAARCRRLAWAPAPPTARGCDACHARRVTRTLPGYWTINQ
jgi:hypothetical protein